MRPSPRATSPARRGGPRAQEALRGRGTTRRRGGGGDDDRGIGQVLLGRLSLSVSLGERRDRLEGLKRKWVAGDVMGCVESCQAFVDGDREDGGAEGAAVVVDFLRAADLKSDKVMRLDVCAGLLQLLGEIVLPERGGGDGDDNDESFGNR